MHDKPVAPKSSAYAPAALQGMRVVEIGQLAAVPACGQILSDLGAEVIKVETSRGDVSRHLGPMIDNQVGPFYASLNRGKRSVCATIRGDSTPDSLHRLIASADVVITNLDRGSLRGARLDWESVRREHQSLVYVEISGYEREGPSATDSLIQEAMGITSVTGPESGPRYRCGAIVVDMTAAVWASLAVVSALLGRTRTGAGEHIQIALSDVALYLQTSNLAIFREDPTAMRQRGNHSNVTCTPVFTASDGRFGVAVLHRRHWSAFCAEVGRPDLTGDARFATNQQRTAAQGLIETLLDPLISQRSRAEWVSRLTARRVPCAPERGYDEILDDSSLWQKGSLFELSLNDTAGARKVLQTRLPLFFESTEIPRPTRAPELGEGTDEILGALDGLRIISGLEGSGGR